MGLFGSQTSTLNFILGLAVGLVVAFLASNMYSLTQINMVPYSPTNSTSLLKILKTIDMNQNGSAVDEIIHKELDQNVGEVRPISFEDEKFHEDNDKLANKLKEKVRVLCWVMTSPQNLDKKAIHVKKTWAKRCNVLVFISSTTNNSFPTVGLNVDEGREHLTAKTMKAFKYVYEHYFDDADWFMKADDDTYVILENLRYFLSAYSPSDPVYFGHHFKTIVKQGYYSGGAGYVLSKEALRRLITKGVKDPNICRPDGGAEDAEMGHCMERLGVKTMNSTDALGRSRFHCFDPETHMFGGYPDWYYQYDANGAKKGTESISDYAISFHYVPPQKMYALEFYIYHLRPYGIESGHQNLNTNVNATT